MSTNTPGTSTSFGPLKQADAGVLDVGYAEAGPADGPAVVLLHRWPYDIHSYAGVAPLLAAAGYRVVVPYLRGYGTTRFLSAATFRNGQQSALAVDIVALMEWPLAYVYSNEAAQAPVTQYGGLKMALSQHRLPERQRTTERRRD